jgi:hypothetical protein
MTCSKRNNMKLQSTQLAEALVFLEASADKDGWNCLATVDFKHCTTGNHPFYSWSSVSVNVLISPLAASLPLDSSFLLCLSAGMGVNSPGANFLVSLLGGFSFSQFSVFQGFQAVFLDAKAEVLGSVDKSVLDGRPM